MTTKAIEAGARAILDRLNAVAPAVENLASNQQQADMDGCMVTVSRQAIDEVLSAINDIAIMIVTAPPALASGELVPASAVAAERERCALACKAIAAQAEKQLEKINEPPESKACQTFATISNTADDCAETIRALEPASGEFVVVPREPTEAMIEAGCEANPTQWNEGTDLGFAADVAHDVYRAMLAAATKDGSTT